MSNDLEVYFDFGIILAMLLPILYFLLRKSPSNDFIHNFDSDHEAGFALDYFKSNDVDAYIKIPHGRIAYMVEMYSLHVVNPQDRVLGIKLVAAFIAEKQKTQ